MTKYLATLKYLFFPFLMANSTGTDFTSMFHNHESVKVTVETVSFKYFGADAGLWKVNTDAQQQVSSTSFLSASEMAANTTHHHSGQIISVNEEFLMPDKCELAYE